MSGTLLAVARQQFADADGAPYAAGTLTFYEPGTSTPATVYSDVALTIALANPLTLDSAGRAAAIYVGSASIDVTLKTSAGATVWGPTTVPSSSLASANIGQGPPFFGSAESPITGTSYPTGTTYASMHAGTAIIPIDSANLDGTYKLRGMLLSPGGTTVSVILVNLSDGSPETALATISSVSTTGEVQTSGAITFPAAGATKNYGLKAKVTSGTGFAWALELIRSE